MDLPHQIQRFELTRELGSGGMGTVYLAHDPQLARAVAIKILHEVPDPAQRSELSTYKTVKLVETAHGRGMFHEARIMAQLSHPNVVSIYELGLEGNEVFVVMAFVDGTNLRTWLERPRTTHDILAAFAQAARGLAAAHEQGIVHRDFKPENVLVGRDGRIQVTDFGVARMIGVPDRLNDRLGTPRYMAPELWRGEEATVKADTYAFVVALLEALDPGGPEPPQVTSALRRRLPRALCALLEAGLAPHPDARPELAQLGEALEHRRGPRWRWIAGGIAVVGAATATATVLAREEAPWRPRIVDLPVFEEDSWGIALAPDGHTLAFSSDREQRRAFRIYVDDLRHPGSPRAVTPPGVTAIRPRFSRDGTKLLFVELRDTGQRIARIPTVGGAVVDLGEGAWVDDCGDGYVVVEPGTIDRLVFRGHDGSRHELATSTSKIEDIFSVQCAPGGQRVLFARGSTLKSIAADVFVVDRAGAVAPVTSDHASAFPTFTSDGKHVVVATERQGKTHLYEHAIGAARAHQLTFDAGFDRSPVVGEGDTLVYVRKIVAMIMFTNTASGVRRVHPGQELFVRAAPSQDGSWVVAERIANQRDSDLVVLDVGADTSRVLGPGARPALSRDEQTVYYRAVADRRRLEAIGIDGRGRRTLATFAEEIASVADGPDGVHVQLDDRSGWWVDTTGAVHREGTGLTVPAPAGAWRAVIALRDDNKFDVELRDGATIARKLVVASPHLTWIDEHRLGYAADGGFKVIEVTTGATLASLPVPELGLRYAVLARDATHWFVMEERGRATLHVIANFGARPWR